MPDAIVIDIVYHDLFNILTKIGGISVILKFLLLIFVKVIVQKHWSQAVISSVSSSDHDPDKLRKNIKKRISYKGINDLHEKVNHLENEL